MIPHEHSEPCDVSGDDRVGGVLESPNARILPFQPLDVAEQLRPALETVQATQHELGIGQDEPAFSNLCVGERAKARVVRTDPFDGFAIAGSKGLQEVLGLFPRLLERDAR
ncbi:MAG TPA: hypothetical protein VMV46_18125 [Thermoanaerobaculia bacterium]|nr:hypothetical protein [Thermoanaerobaculia bacterium]